MKRNLLPGLLVILTTLPVLAGPAVDLSWVPEAGKERRYKVENKHESPMGGLMTVQYSSTVSIVQVDEKTVQVRTENSTPMVLRDGQMAQGVQIRIPNTSQTYARNGLFLQSDASSPTGARLGILSSVVRPRGGTITKEGQTWVQESPADTEKGTFSSRTTYTFRGSESIGPEETYKVEIQFQELEGDVPISGEGMVWISAADGAVVQEEISLRNVNLGMGPMEMTVGRTLLASQP